MTQITVEIKNVFGVNKIYPVCSIAKLFAEIANTKTLSKSNIKIIEELGYSIIISHKYIIE